MKRIYLTMIIVVIVASVANAQMTNINVNGTSNSTPAPSVLIVPEGQADTFSIPRVQPYVIVENTPNSGMVNLNFNNVASTPNTSDTGSSNSSHGAASTLDTLHTIPQAQPRVVIRPAANGRMTNVNINNGGTQTILEPIPNAGAFVIIQPRLSPTPTIVQTPVPSVQTPVPSAPTTTVVTTPAPVATINPPTPVVVPPAPAATPIVSTPAPTPPVVVSTPVTPLTPQPSPSFSVPAPEPAPIIANTPPTPTVAAQPGPGTIQTQTVVAQPIRQIYGESRWFGAALPTRNFNQYGLGIRYGIIDFFAPLIDGRFDFDYYVVGGDPSLEFAINAQFLVASTSSPANRSLYFDVFTGLGPRLYITDDSTALGVGGYIETEMRYGSLAPFIAVDATVPIYTFQATGNQTSIDPLLIGVEVGVNFYF